MEIEVKRRTTEELIGRHALYRAEANCQLIRDSFWARGFLDAWEIEIDGRFAGYGAVANRYDKGRVIEFYALLEYRRHAVTMFQQLLAASEATHVEAQTNVPLMLLMLHDCATGIRAEKVLFADAYTTQLTCPEGGIFRHKREAEERPIFEHHHEPEGDWVIEAGGAIVATGGFLTHYNPPYGDIYMEVIESRRGRGFGSFLIQELKRVCYENGRRPAARCDVANAGSRKTLEKAGLLACGHLLVGEVK
jgi:GNAT superfamily N-acetyltransferase